MSDTAVVFNVLARDRASRVFRGIARAASEGSSGIAAALGPALLPAVGAATAGVVGFAGAVGGAGAALGVFGIVAGTAFAEVQDVGNKVSNLRDKVALLDSQLANASGKEREALLKRQAAATAELNARLNMLPPSQRAVVTQYGNLVTAFKAFVDQNRPAVYAPMSGAFKFLTAILPKLQPLFDVGAAAASRLVGWLNRVSANGGIDRLVAFLATQAGPALDKLGAIAKNMGTVIGAAFRSTAPAGQGMLNWLVQLSDKAASFASGGGFDRFMTYVSTNGSGVASSLGSIATTVGNLYTAVSPLAPVSLAVAKALAAIIAAVPPGVITAVVAAWIAYSIAMKAHGTYVTASGIATELMGKKQAVATAATKAAAAGQWLLNAAMAAGNWAKAAASLGLFAAKQAIIAVATKAWTAAQWLLNVAMSMNPIGLVILAIVALIAIFVLLWTKCAWFRNFWIAVWNVIKTAASAAWAWIKSAALAFWNWIRNVPGWVRDKWNAGWNAIKTGASNAWTWIRNKVTAFRDWIFGLPGKISDKLRGMWDGMKSGFKAAVNWVISKMRSLNFTIGGGSIAGVDIPKYTIGFGNIPYLAKGGNVMRAGSAIVGERGPEMVSLRRGAQVTPLNRRGGSGDTARLLVDVRGGDQDLKRLIRRWIRDDNLLQGA